MRVLLTGHKGYIGTVSTSLLIEAGHEVLGMDSDLYRACTFGEKDRIIPIPELKKDIRDVKTTDLEGFDAVLHLAGFSNDPLGDLNPELTYEVNFQASVRLAQIAKKAGVRRFIFSSSCSNYGAAGDDWVEESSSLNPVTPYGRSKVQAEQGIMELADRNFCSIFPRSATAYGFSPRLRFDLVLNNLVAWAFTTGRVHLKSDGMAWRPITHIEDISRAFVAMLHAPDESVRNQVFNVGRTQENYRIRELAEIVAQIVPGSRIEHAVGASRDERCYRVNCDKLAETLPDYKPVWTARKGASELYSAFQKHDLTLEEFEGTKYKRVAHVKHLMATGKVDSSMRWQAEKE
jgi:nucleoside-diphosphate-sugar epimerase